MITGNRVEETGEAQAAEYSGQSLKSESELNVTECVIWIVATADIGVFTDIGDKKTRYRVTCHDIGFFV